METDPVPDSGKEKDLKMMTQVIYACFLGSLLIGFSGLVGIILAYIKRGDAEGTIYASHIQWQIRTFWLSLAGSLLGLVLTVIGIGILILLAVAVWWIYRCVKGWLKVYEGKPIDDPKAWI